MLPRLQELLALGLNRGKCEFHKDDVEPNPPLTIQSLCDAATSSMMEIGLIDRSGSGGVTASGANFVQDVFYLCDKFPYVSHYIFLGKSIE